MTSSKGSHKRPIRLSIDNRDVEDILEPKKKTKKSIHFK